MPRRSKGAYLYLREDRTDHRTGRAISDLYVIRDGQTQVSTGYGPDSLSGAERMLAEYISRKYANPSPLDTKDLGDPTKVGAAEVLALYVRERAPLLAADPQSTAGFVKSLLGFWGLKTLAEVKRSSCSAYVKWRTLQPIKGAVAGTRLVSEQTARRELETLSAAVGYWDDEHHLAHRPKVTLPVKPNSPRSAISRTEAAALLRASRGWRRNEEGKWTRLGSSSKANRAHLARFILLAIYTGTRSGALLDLRWDGVEGRGWVDLDRGVMHRRGSADKEHRNKRRPPVKVPLRLLGHLKRWRRMDAIRQSVRMKNDPAFRLSAILHHGGEPIRDKISRGFARCVADAGLSNQITPHWLRHTAATWLMEAGVDLWDAAGYLGMTVQTLEKNYGHHRSDFQAAASLAISTHR